MNTDKTDSETETEQCSCDRLSYNSRFLISLCLNPYLIRVHLWLVLCSVLSCTLLAFAADRFDHAFKVFFAIVVRDFFAGLDVPP